MPTVSALPVPSRNTVQRGTGSGLTSGFGMSPGVSPNPMTVGKVTSSRWVFKCCPRHYQQVRVYSSIHFVIGGCNREDGNHISQIAQGNARRNSRSSATSSGDFRDEITEGMRRKAEYFKKLKENIRIKISPNSGNSKTKLIPRPNRV